MLTVLKLRAYTVKVDGRAALDLKQQGLSLRQIRAALAPGASLTSVWSAVRRAKDAA
jgi:hypothetical protein